MTVAPQVHIPNYGTVQGSMHEAQGVAVFKNIPYASAPERWRVAVKPQPWTGVRDATKQGPICPQPTSLYILGALIPEEYVKQGKGSGPLGLDMDELDGLNLNLFVPASALEDKAKPVPVMVWIHGGAFRDGANGVPLYDSVDFVKRSIDMGKPTIVITVNYRLNAFGFLASKELEQDMKDHVAASASTKAVSTYDQSIGNWGLQDQRLAFEWVRENIAAFGGQADNVTAFGESAGSISLHYHLTSPSHHGLFDHAILQSGTVATITPGHVHTDGQVVFDSLLEQLSIPLELDGPEKIKRLRAISMEELTIASSKVTAGGWKPYYDNGHVLASTDIDTPTYVLDKSTLDPKLRSLMIGVNKDEGTAFAPSFLGQGNIKTWPFVLEKICPVPQLRPLFDGIYGSPETDLEVAQLLGKYVGDMMFVHPTEVASKTFSELAKSRNSTPGEVPFNFVRYNFDAQMAKMETIMPGLGALHAGELPFVFGPPMVDLVLNEKELGLSKEMQTLWIQFANQDAYKTKGGVVPEQGQAYVMTNEQEIVVEKATRLSPEAMMFWGKIAEATAQKARAGFSKTKEE